MSDKDHRPEPNRNPGEVGKNGERNAMDRHGNTSGSQTFTNPGQDTNSARTGQSGESGGLGSQQADDEGGLGGQGLGNRQSGRTVDDNQDDLGNDVNKPDRASTNNR